MDQMYNNVPVPLGIETFDGHCMSRKQFSGLKFIMVKERNVTIFPFRFIPLAISKKTSRFVKPFTLLLSQNQNIFLTYIYELTYNLWCPSSGAAMCNLQGMVGMMTVHHIPVHSF
jgi:hypothetical protein